jgi:hypothetical protein
MLSKLRVLILELATYFKDYFIIGVSKESYSKIQGNSNFLELKTFLSELKPTSDILCRIKKGIQKNTYVMEKILSLTNIEDKFLSEMIREYNGTYNCNFIPSVLTEMFKDIKEIKDFIKNDSRLSNHLYNYSLLKEYWSAHGQGSEIAIYINAKYHLTIGKK